MTVVMTASPLVVAVSTPAIHELTKASRNDSPAGGHVPVRHPRACLTRGISCKGRGSLAGADLVSFIPLFDCAVLYPVVAVPPVLIVARTSIGIRFFSREGMSQRPPHTMLPFIDPAVRCSAGRCSSWASSIAGGAVRFGALHRARASSSSQSNTGVKLQGSNLDGPCQLQPLVRHAPSPHLTNRYALSAGL